MRNLMRDDSSRGRMYSSNCSSWGFVVLWKHSNGIDRRRNRRTIEIEMEILQNGNGKQGAERCMLYKIFYQEYLRRGGVRKSSGDYQELKKLMMMKVHTRTRK
jgi:hypothetical protein